MEMISARKHMLQGVIGYRLAADGLSSGGRRPHSSDRATGPDGAQTLNVAVPVGSYFFPSQLSETATDRGQATPSER